MFTTASKKAKRFKFYVSTLQSTLVRQGLSQARPDVYLVRLTGGLTLRRGGGHA